MLIVLVAAGIAVVVPHFADDHVTTADRMEVCLEADGWDVFVVDNKLRAVVPRSERQNYEAEHDRCFARVKSEGLSD